MHEKKCNCQILEVEGKFVSSPGDIFIHLFVCLLIYLFIYLFCDGKRVTTKTEK